MLALILCWDMHYVWDFHTPLMLHLSCSQPTKHPASWFELHINLLLSMEKSRSEWGNLPLVWADHLVLAISPWWSWQSSHTFTVRWNQWHWEWWGTESPCLASVAVLDLALRAKGSLLSPQASLWFRVEFLFLKHRRPENSLVHTAWSGFFFCFSLELTLCVNRTSMCVLEHLWVLLILGTPATFISILTGKSLIWSQHWQPFNGWPLVTPQVSCAATQVRNCLQWA